MGDGVSRGSDDGHRKPVILVVDDEPGVAETLTDFLALDGYEVETAPNGRLALERIGQRVFDAILSDIRMPGLSGIDLYHALERDQPHLTRRFVLVTGSALTAEARQFLAETKVPIVSKPFSMQELRHIMGRLLAS
jgi:CheY-like chemotaxis protein